MSPAPNLIAGLNQPCVIQDIVLVTPSQAAPLRRPGSAPRKRPGTAPLVRPGTAPLRVKAVRRVSHGTGTCDMLSIVWPGVVDKRTALPPATACESVGLEVAVRAWWHGASGRPRSSSSQEDAWIRTAAAGGLAGGAKVRLLRSGIPEVVLEGGLELAKFLQEDEEARQIWNEVEKEEVEFIACAVEQLFGRFSIRATVPFSTQDRCLVLTPRPPDRPTSPCASSRSNSAHGPRQGSRPQSREGSRPQSRNRNAPPPWVAPAPLMHPPWSEAHEADRAKQQRQAEHAEHAEQRERRRLQPGRSTATPEAGLDQPAMAATTDLAWADSLGNVQTQNLGRALRQCAEAAQDLERSGSESDVPEMQRQSSGRSEKSTYSFSPSSPSSSVVCSPGVDGDRSDSQASPFARTHVSRARESMRKSLNRKKEGLEDGAARADAAHRRPDSADVSKSRKSVRPVSAQAAQSRMHTMPEMLHGTKQPRRPSHGHYYTVLARGQPKYGAARPTQSNFDLWVQKTKQKQLEQDDNEAPSEMPTIMKQRTGCMFTGSNRKSGLKKVVRDINEVRQSFNYFDADCSGYIDPSEFMTLLSRLMQLPKSELDMTEVWRHWDLMDTDQDGSINFEEFSNWYCNTFKIEHPDFTNFFHEGLLTKEYQTVREVARKLGVDNVDIENIYTEFKKLDDDGNGRLSFDEFKSLITTRVRRKSWRSQAEVPRGVVQKFWNEISEKGSDGCCGFEAFASWYLNFFHSDVSPMEHYYQSLGRNFRASIASSNVIYSTAPAEKKR